LFGPSAEELELMEPRILMKAFAVVPAIDIITFILLKRNVAGSQYVTWWKWPYRLDLLVALPKFAAFGAYMALKEMSGPIFYQACMYSLYEELFSLSSIYYANSKTSESPSF
jgi:hypothetical protein